MARPRKDQRLPGGHRRTSSGRITFTIRTPDGQRLSQNKILSSEPKSYATVEEAIAGHKRVTDYLASEIDRALTVRGFWDRWTDVDDPEWGVKGSERERRGEHAIYTYASRTRAFVERFGERAMASMTELDLKTWRLEVGVSFARSTLPVLQTFFKDAETAGLRVGTNPASRLANIAKAQLVDEREENREDPPDLQTVNRMLAHLQHAGYPRSFYGWMLTAARTGMRGSEVDGMQWEFLHDDVYEIEWQLHPRTNRLTVPKHRSRRKVVLPPEVMAEIERVRPAGRGDMAEIPFIWLNTCRTPWRHDSRQKWFEKEIDGTSAQAIVDGATMYQSTRHHWASWAVNVAGISPYRASILYGHKDGGRLITSTYANKDNDAAIDAVREATKRQDKAA